MNTALWILQGLVGAAFAMAGLMKLMTPREKLLPKMGWVEDFDAGPIRLIGLAELLGGLGLVLPRALGILPVLTPLAAVGLVLVMSGAVRTHLRRHESFTPPLVLGALAALVALGRFGLVP